MEKVQTEEGKTVYRNKSNDVRVTLPERMDKGRKVTVAFENYRISFSLQAEESGVKIRSRKSAAGIVHQPTEGKLEALKAAYVEASASSGAASRSASTVIQDTMTLENMEKLSEATLVEAINEEMRTVRKLESGIRYSGVIPGVEVSYTLKAREIKESLILDRLPEQEAYTYEIESGGLKGYLQENGAVEFRDGEKCVYSIQSPYMWDAAGETSHAVEV